MAILGTFIEECTKSKTSCTLGIKCLNWQTNFVTVNTVGLSRLLLWLNDILCRVHNSYVVTGTIITKNMPKYLILYKNIYDSYKFKWRKYFNCLSMSRYVSEGTQALDAW